MQRFKIKSWVQKTCDSVGDYTLRMMEYARNGLLFCGDVIAQKKNTFTAPTPHDASGAPFGALSIIYALKTWRRPVCYYTAAGQSSCFSVTFLN